jgi:hypothetical protein
MSESNKSKFDEFLRYAASSFLPKSVMKKFSKEEAGN